MAVPSALRSNYSDLYGSDMLPALEELFRSEYNQHPMKRNMLGKTVSTDNQIWQYTETHDMPLFSEVSEGADYTFNRQKQGSDKTLTVLKYGLGFSISEEAVADGRFDMISDAVRKMAKSARESQEQAFMDLLNNGFGSETTADGQPIFDQAHTTPTGTITVRNELASPADLSESSLRTAIKDFRTVFRGDSGIYYDIKPKFLVVPEDLRLEAKAIVGSELKPGGTNNDKNVLSDEGLIVISSPHLTDADAWFLIGDPMDNGLRIVSRQPLQTLGAEKSVGYINDAIYYKARYREKVGAVHHNGLFGSPGV